jgi:hypothetical protein
VPIETRGPPNPNNATEANRSVKPVEKILSREDTDTTIPPINRDFSTPNRSVIIPIGWAEKMYMSCHAPLITPICV